ncbi:MAG: phospho-sugar mutase [Bacilli bacterium]|nr:phospho-sugar mutase [Bacilli bacterium]
MEQSILNKFNEWLDSPLLNEKEKAELASIKDDDKEIIERFYRELEFGTGGLRGVMALGTNRMNRFIIAKATQGLANYVLSKYKNPSVAIGHDSRNNSDSFSKVAAAVLAANGIKVYIYPELMPTPAVSFAVRYLKCSSGIVVTASHNPKQYNGYKVYGDDGCQCTIEAADAIYAEIQKIDVFKDVKYGDFDELVKTNKIEIIGNDIFEAYMASTLKQSIYKEEKILKAVYTPLYGAGRKCVTTALARDGFDVHVVKEQENPNGDFPTCPYPNPEIHDALKLGIEQLLNENADILIATDPDSDRIGVVVNQNGAPKILTGNEVGLLLFDTIYHARKDSLKKPGVLVKTIVSTDMANVMARDWGVEVREVLTGFKYIGEQILFLEQDNEKERYLLGFEESCGYLTNTDVRDKDAVNASLLVMEMANHLKHSGLTLVDRLNQLYAKYGSFTTGLLTYEFQGVEGAQKIKDLMKAFRDEKIGEAIPNIDHVGDYLTGEIKYANKVEPTNLPASDVVKFFLKDSETITIRPSGTEPKLKAYIFAKSNDSLEAHKKRINDFILK